MKASILFGIPNDYLKIWNRWTRKFRGPTKQRARLALKVIDRVLVVLFVALYVLLGWGCLTTSPGSGIGYLAASALSFGLLSLFRRRYNEPRPYELFKLTPLVAREGAGKSFPSRHCFCAFLIATITFAVFQPFGGFAILAAILLGWLRVLEGVHFPRDIIAGAVLGVLGGLFTLAATLWPLFS